LRIDCERTARTAAHQRVEASWQDIRCWFQANSFTPRWLPAAWQRPLLGYLAAVLIEVLAIGITLLLFPALPIFALQGSLVILGIVLVALNCGAGPGLLATLVGAALLDAFLRFPQLPEPLREVEGYCVLLFSLIGFSIGLIASQSARARRQAEEMARSLKEEQARTEIERQRLRTLLDVLPAGVGMVDTQGRLLETNPALITLCGPEAVPGKFIQFQAQRAWQVDSRAPVATGDCAMARALTRGETALNEEAEEIMDGQRKVVLRSVAPIRDETGAISGAVGILQDITERKQLEQELAERAAQLEAIFESIVDGLVVTDKQGRILHMNPALRTLLGVEQNPEGLSMPALEQRDGFSASNAQEQPLAIAERPLNRYLRGETLTREQSVDLIVHTRDGRQVNLNNSGAPIRDKAGHLLGAVEVVRDVTEQRRLEQQTRDALHALLEMAEALVLVQDMPLKPSGGQRLPPAADPTVYVVARRLAELTRRVLGCQQVSIAAVEPESALLRPVTVVGLSPEQETRWWAGWEQPHYLDQQTHSYMMATPQTGEPVILERTHPAVRTWEQLFSAQRLLFVPMLVGGTLVGILEVDYGPEEYCVRCPNKLMLAKAVARLGALVLERERLLRERARAQANELALRETNQQMDTFLGMAGHELKNPLAILKLSTQLAERRIQRLVERGAEAARDIKPALDPLASTQYQLSRLERLVNDILDVSRVQAGKLELRPDYVDLVDIVRAAVEEQRQVAPTRALLLHLPGDARAPIYADAERIGQVVTNYLTNALKYSPVECSVFVGLDIEGQQARVWVRDEGPGLPAEEQERIWERFHRARGIEVQSGTGVGLGLGLHICRTIIERQQGQVGVRSMSGAGSTFWFTLPLSCQDGQRSDNSFQTLQAI
jgi:PAS domain S-box-containing protein